VHDGPPNNDSGRVEGSDLSAPTRLLLDAITELLGRYVVLPGQADSVAVALFVLHTWAINGAHATPYLLVVSPEKRSGKTRLLELLALLVRQPWHTTSTSEAALFRRIERDCPTLLLDEIDALFGSNAERTEPLRAILNGGNRRGATVTRCVGKEHEVHDFGVFCPKVLAGIDKDRRLPDTIRDRAVTLHMRRRHNGESVERFRERKVSEQTAAIREALGAWASDAVGCLYAADPYLPDELSDRAQDAWEPLLAVAELAGGDWPERARQAAIELCGNGEPDETSNGALLLSAIKPLMQGRENVATQELLRLINENDDLPFGAWGGGKGLDARTLARLLKPYGVTPRSVRIGAETPKGYRNADFHDPWTRYTSQEAQQTQHAQHAQQPNAGEPASRGHEKPNGANLNQNHERELVARVADVADVADLNRPLPSRHLVSAATVEQNAEFERLRLKFPEICGGAA
jgi:hypothetical protein